MFIGHRENFFIFFRFFSVFFRFFFEFVSFFFPIFSVFFFEICPFFSNFFPIFFPKFFKQLKVLAKCEEKVESCCEGFIAEENGGKVLKCVKESGCGGKFFNDKQGVIQTKNYPGNYDSRNIVLLILTICFAFLCDKLYI